MSEIQTNSSPGRVAGFVLGIVGVVLCWLGPLTLAASIVGLILANKAKANGSWDGLNKASYVLNIIGIVFSGLNCIWWIPLVFLGGLAGLGAAVA